MHVVISTHFKSTKNDKGKIMWFIFSISSPHSIQECSGSISFTVYASWHKLYNNKKMERKRIFQRKMNMEQKVQVNEFLLSKIDATNRIYQEFVLSIQKLRTCSIWQFFNIEIIAIIDEKLFIKKMKKGYAKKFERVFKSLNSLCVCYWP